MNKFTSSDLTNLMLGASLSSDCMKGMDKSKMPMVEPLLPCLRVLCTVWVLTFGSKGITS